MRALVLLAVSLLSAVIAAVLGSYYIPRLSNHAGYELIEVVDPVVAAPTTRPRSVTLVVVDGLREDSARSMRTVEQLSSVGQCRTSDVGPYTVSRPVYALLSTGLEVARNGARNNHDTSPLAAESVWDVAAEASLRVGVSSHLPWWSQLFPRAFSDSAVLPEPEDVFSAATALGTEVTVIHPVMVDTAGHEYGAASNEYRDAVATVDTQAHAWLQTLDLQRDLVIFTADHGHTHDGGHGGPAPELRNVVACFAGPGIRPDRHAEPIDARVIAPAIAMSLGLRFPRHMRAGEDGLDALWGIFDPDAMSPAYIDDRRRSVEVFRHRNTHVLAETLGPERPPLHSAWVQRQRLARLPIISALLAFLGLGLAASLLRRGLSGEEALRSCLWIAATFVVTATVWTVARGSFDYTSIKERTPFLLNSLMVCGGVALAMVVLHRHWLRDPSRWAADQATIAALDATLMLLHPLAFGWPLGNPLPHPALLFAPFLMATFGVVHGLVGVAASVRELVLLRSS